MYPILTSTSQSLIDEISTLGKKLFNVGSGNI